MLNIHHLELFYYVATHGGISEAVRQMPYGIQQPAVSGQIISLEEHLGKPLFKRRPFQLTPAGEELLQFIKPFFSGLKDIESKVRDPSVQLLRIAAAAQVLKAHLPQILDSLRKGYPELRFSLHEALQPEVEMMLQRREVDCGITVLENKIPDGIESETLINLPLALLVPAKSRWKTLDNLLQQERLAEPLVCLPEREPVTRQFFKALRERNSHWPVVFEVSSLELIETYVASGFGIGLTIQVPGQPIPRSLRLVSLDDFSPIQIAILWHGAPDQIITALIRELKAHASSISKLK